MLAREQFSIATACGLDKAISLKSSMAHKSPNLGFRKV